MTANVATMEVNQRGTEEQQFSQGPLPTVGLHMAEAPWPCCEVPVKACQSMMHLSQTGSRNILEPQCQMLLEMGSDYKM